MVNGKRNYIGLNLAIFHTHTTAPQIVFMSFFLFKQQKKYGVRWNAIRRPKRNETKKIN